MKICLVASPGGHLTQLLYLADALEGSELFYITYREERALLNPRTYLIENPWTKPLALLAMVPRMLTILIRERPQVVISTGGEIALPAFLIARFLLRSETIFIESLARIRTRSVTGLLLYPISSLFLVQWLSLLPRYGRKAIYWGSLL